MPRASYFILRIAVIKDAQAPAASLTSQNSKLVVRACTAGHSATSLLHDDSRQTLFSSSCRLHKLHVVLRCSAATPAPPPPSRLRAFPHIPARQGLSVRRRIRPGLSMTRLHQRRPLTTTPCQTSLIHSRAERPAPRDECVHDSHAASRTGAPLCSVPCPGGSVHQRRR